MKHANLISYIDDWTDLSGPQSSDYYPAVVKTLTSLRDLAYERLSFFERQYIGSPEVDEWGRLCHTGCAIVDEFCKLNVSLEKRYNIDGTVEHFANLGRALRQHKRISKTDVGGWREILASVLKFIDDERLQALHEAIGDGPSLADALEAAMH